VAPGYREATQANLRQAHLQTWIRPALLLRIPVMDACFSRLPTALPVAGCGKELSAHDRGGGLRVGPGQASAGWQVQTAGSRRGSWASTAALAGGAGVVGGKPPCMLLGWVRSGFHARRPSTAGGNAPPSRSWPDPR